MQTLFDPHDLFPEPELKVDFRVLGPKPARKFGDARKPVESYAGRILQRWDNCVVTWLEWSGKLTNPTATPRTAEGVTVIHRGHKTVELSGGTLPAPIRRKIGAQGFRVVHARRIVIDEETQLGPDKRII